MNTPCTSFAGRLAQAYFLSLVVALLLAAVSLAGILLRSELYPTQDLRQSFVSNDVVNLLIGLPFLLVSLLLAYRARLIGLLFWLGALLYIAYNAIAYVVALPWTMQFVIYLVQLILTVYTIYILLSRMDADAIRQRLAGKVPEHLAGGVLAGLGLLFFGWRVVQLVSLLTGQDALTQSEFAVLVADLLTTPAWVAGGILLWRKQALGYTSGAALLFQGSMLFVGLLVFFALQPFLAGLPFPAADFGVTLIMGLVCFIPFGLFVRGVLKRA